MLLGIHPVVTMDSVAVGCSRGKKKREREAWKKREEGGPLATGKRMDEQSELERDARETQQKASGKKKKNKAESSATHFLLSSSRVGAVRGEALGMLQMRH